MELRNKDDGVIYHVRTEDDHHEGFMIFATTTSSLGEDFCMHYRSLKEFNEEWEDL